MQLTVRLALLFGSPVIAGCTTPAGPKGQDTPTLPTTSGPERLCFVDVACFGNILDEPKAPCAMTVADADGTVVYDGLAGFELRGRSSLAFPKPQYAVELREHTELPVWPGAIWAYLDDGSDPGATWFDPAYDDASWSSGAAPLGYAADYLATTIQPSVTTYLRTEFQVYSAASGEDLEVGLLRGDGVVVYLNGVEVLRDGVPIGATADTRATQSVSPSDAMRWLKTQVDPALLVDGTNVLAVELHQGEDASDDLRFDLYLDLSTERESDLFGMGSDADWILNGQYVDRALYRNRLAYDLFQSFGGVDRYATETTFCELALNGAYQGIYTLGEKIGRSDHRLPIDNDGAPGDAFIIKLDDEGGFHDNAVGRGTWQLVYPNDPDPEAVANVTAFLESWEAAVNGPDPADPETGLFALLDLESTVDFVLLQELMKNVDSYQLSVHLWKEPGGKMHFTPWDFDLSMGYPNTDCGHEGWTRRDYATPDGVLPIAWIEEVAAVPAFRTALVERWRELRQTVLSESSILARIDAYQTTLEPAIADNFEVWPMQSIVFTAGGYDDLLCPVGSYEEEHARTLDFLTGRLAWMDAHIESF